MTADDLQRLVDRERMAAEHHDTVEQLQAENAELEEALTAATTSMREAMRQRRVLIAALRELALCPRISQVGKIIARTFETLKVKP